MLYSSDSGQLWTMSRFAGARDEAQPGALIVSRQQSVWADGPPGLRWRTTNGGLKLGDAPVVAGAQGVVLARGNRMFASSRPRCAGVVTNQGSR
jgi:hypothetical protein